MAGRRAGGRSVLPSRLLLVALVLRPQILHPLNRAWLALGRLLHRVVSPLVMGAIFFLCVTPTAWIMRLRGKDVLSLLAASRSDELLDRARAGSRRSPRR